MDGGKGGGISKGGVKDGSRDEDAPSTSGGDPGGEPKRARSEIPMRDGSSKANAQAAPPTGMKQLFLDLGQKNFGHCKCPTCGLLYAKGEPEDERTHAKFHAEFTAQSSAGHHTRTSGLSSGSSLGPDGLTGAPYMTCPKNMAGYRGVDLRRRPGSLRGQHRRRRPQDAVGEGCGTGAEGGDGARRAGGVGAA